ncbi:MAG: hypothetical protein V7724_05745 [Sediminicola sp.]|tara:strand:+ start:133361 stop:133585 length:225 start_codon:yes stop_codon:yes gene_type:complete
MKKIKYFSGLLFAVILFSSSINNSESYQKLTDIKFVEANDLDSHAQTCGDGGVQIVCYGNGDGCMPTTCLKPDH